MIEVRERLISAFAGLVVGIAVIVAFASAASHLERIMLARYDRCHTDASYKYAKDALAKSKYLIAAKNYGGADAVIDKAIKRLGNSYYVLSNDDTGMNIGTADYERKRGHLATAAQLKWGSLESRLDMFEFKYCDGHH